MLQPCLNLRCSSQPWCGGNVSGYQSRPRTNLPLSFLFLRFLLGTLVVCVVLVLMRRALTTNHRYAADECGCEQLAVSRYVLQTVGLHLTTASNSAFITVLYVVFVPLYLRRLGAHTWVSNGMALVGLWFLVKPAASANLGDVLTLGSAAAFAAHISSVWNGIRG